MTEKQRKLEQLKENIVLTATNHDFVEMVIALAELDIYGTLEQYKLTEKFLDNIKRVKFEDKFSMRVYALLETYENVVDNWKENLTVQQLIDELMKVENKELPVNFYNDGYDFIDESTYASILDIDIEVSDYRVCLNGEAI